MEGITWNDVEDIAPDLTDANGVSTGAQTMILEFVNNHLDAARWGGEGSATLKLGRCYLAAHLGIVTKNQMGEAGPVSSESAGGLSRSYAVTASSDEGLSGTTWGKQYLMMARLRFGGAYT